MILLPRSQLRVTAIGLALILSNFVAARSLSQDQSGVFDDYNQWKQALGAEGAADAAKIAALPGYEVELIRSAGKEEGSWVSLTFDPKGRILIAREDKGILRLTLPATSGEPTIETINDTLHECRGLLWAYDSLYANANNDKSLYRLRDLDKNDQFEEVKLLRTSPGDVGHGRNDLVLGPDGLIYSIHGNDTRLPENYKDERSPYRNYAIDRPIPCEWNQQLFNWGAGPPAGHVIRTDQDGKRWEMVAGGFRNPFGIDFNPDGEMFTFDADMEWEVGLPWYRPCRVNHIVAGGDYGWRQGVNKWSAWYPDSLPSTLDIGLASPTAVKFGTNSKFPEPMKKAIFILDWAYGRILAVHLAPQGASYSARYETFLKGRPLNVTDLDFGPDGAMYFTTGGRGTKSGLYRVRYTGPTAPETPGTRDELIAANNAKSARETRRMLERLQVTPSTLGVDLLWPYLSDKDLWIRHAARIALERHPGKQWASRALSEKDETKSLVAMLSWARIGDQREQETAISHWLKLAKPTLTPDQKLLWLRGVVVMCARQGKPAAEPSKSLAEKAEGLLASATPEVQQLACELLAALESPALPKVAISLLTAAKTQEERVHYLYVLRHAKEGWTPELRKTYFRSLGEANAFEGAQYVPKVIDFIKQDALASLPEPERAAWVPLIARKPVEPVAIENRTFVRRWEMDDLEGSLGEVGPQRDLARGKAMFDAALCSRCHKVTGQAATQTAAIGPDLSSVASRFGRRDLLEMIISPSKIIDDKYRSALIETKSGKTFQGVVATRDSEAVTLVTNPLFPDKTERIPLAEIESQQASLLSPMPAGLLDTLAKEELLDLLAYLESAGKSPPPPPTNAPPTSTPPKK